MEIPLIGIKIKVKTYNIRRKKKVTFINWVKHLLFDKTNNISPIIGGKSKTKKSEVPQMAKLEGVKTVTVTNKVTGKALSIKTTQAPRENEIGVYMGIKINQIGLAYLQATYPEMKESIEKPMIEKLIHDKLGIPDKGFGTIGVIKTEEDKKTWEIKVSGDTPKKQVAASNDSSKDSVNILIIKGALAKGYDKNLVKAQAEKRFGTEKATELFNLATREEKAVDDDIFEMPELSVVEEEEFVF